MKNIKYLVTVAVSILYSTAAFSSGPVEGAWKPARKKFIDMSWSNPHVDYLVENLERMEKEAPVDGITIRFSAKVKLDGKEKEIRSHQAMTKLKWKYEWFKDSVKKLKSLKFKKFTDNFLYTTMVPGNQDWFSDSDWDAVCNNYRILARIAKETGMKGIVFDPEEYGKRFWGKYPGHSHSEAVAKARQRGREFGKAVFGEFPQAKILALFLFSFGTYLKGDASTVIVSHSFFNGIYDVLPPEATMIEGHEYFGYFAKNPDMFRRLQQDLDRTFLTRVAACNYRKYRSQTQLAAPIYLDSYFFKNNPVYSSLKPEIEKTPKLEFVRKNLSYAFDVSDEYVWCYGEKACWWSKSAHPKAKKTWEEVCPGIVKTVKAVKDPFSVSAADRKNLLDIPPLDKEPGKWLFWTAGKGDGKGSWKDGLIWIKGVKNNACVHQSVTITSGKDYLLRVKARARTPKVSGPMSLSALFRNQKSAWMPQRKTVTLGPGKHGEWKNLAIVIRAPENAKYLSFQLGVRYLKPDEVVEFKEPELFEL